MLKVKPVKVRLLEVGPEMEQGAQSSRVHPPSPGSILPKPHPGTRGCSGEGFLRLPPTPKCCQADLDSGIKSLFSPSLNPTRSCQMVTGS